jgi:hypothetical protein
MVMNCEAIDAFSNVPKKQLEIVPIGRAAD